MELEFEWVHQNGGSDDAPHGWMEEEDCTVNYSGEGEGEGGIILNYLLYYYYCYYYYYYY